MVSIYPHLALVAAELTRLKFPLDQRLKSEFAGHERISAFGLLPDSGFRIPDFKRRFMAIASVKLIFGLVLLASPISRAADYTAQFNKWFEVQTNLQSWSGDFTQTRFLTVLNQPLVTPGKVWVQRGEFRWELGDPVQTVVLRRPDELLIVYPRLKRAEKYPLDAVPSGPMKDALALLDASLPRDRATMEEHFRLLSAALTNGVLQMTLQPRSEAARQFIGEVVIGFHTNDFIIASTEMKFADGSRLQNTFTNVVLNQPLSPDLFAAKLPPDCTISEPLKQ